jgi:hypothetical protein
LRLSALRVHIDDESLVTTSWWTTSTGPHAWSPEFIEARRQSVSLPHDYTQDLAQIQAPEITDAADDVAGSMGVSREREPMAQPMANIRTGWASRLAEIARFI